MSVLDLFNVSPSHNQHFGLFRRFKQIASLSKERAELSKLTSQQLKDIGITPDQAQKEAARPAWDLPENWAARRE